MVDQPALTDADVLAIYDRINNWGRWGKDDEKGTLNHITPARRLAAAKLIQHGVPVSCGNAMDTVPSPMNTLPAQHYMVSAGDLMPADGTGVAYDFFGVFPHGQAQSHLDALCHISHNGRLYNNRGTAEVTSKGARALAITTMTEALCSRGVFLDIAATRGVDFIEQNEPVRAADLDAAEARAGVKVGPGDMVIYRTGRHERRTRKGGQVERLPDGRGNLPGLYPDCLPWLHERDVALIGSDCAHDILPAPFKKEWVPIHVGTEVYMGLPLLHNLKLDDLAHACTDHGRHEFFFMVAPLRINGGTASPVNPIAIF